MADVTKKAIKNLRNLHKEKTDAIAFGMVWASNLPFSQRLRVAYNIVFKKYAGRK